MNIIGPNNGKDTLVNKLDCRFDELDQQLVLKTVLLALAEYGNKRIQRTLLNALLPWWDEECTS